VSVKAIQLRSGEHDHEAQQGPSAVGLSSDGPVEFFAEELAVPEEIIAVDDDDGNVALASVARNA
jgi:hypothetical protein